MNKLEMKSKEIVSDNIERIKNLFPNVIKETEVGHQIDFDLLKQELSNNILDNSKERYQLTWPGKIASILESNTPTNKTLRPLKEKSVDFDNTENIYIEGDNLEVLKVLQESYLNKIKCIYIDPPYNTGNDFIYNDNFNKDIDFELEDSGQMDEESNRLVTNKESNGRFHSDWLSMMYPRLKLARNLLSEEGLIFISIDDNELYNLKQICDEIFGEKNYINTLTIKMSELSGVKMTNLSKYPKLKEYLLIYSKSSLYKIRIEKTQKQEEKMKEYLKYYNYIVPNIHSNINDWKIVELDKYLKENKIKYQSIEELNAWKIQNADKMVYRTNSKTVEKLLKTGKDLPNIYMFKNNFGKTVIKWGDKEMLFLKNYLEEYLGDIWLDISTINLNKENYGLNYFQNGQKPLRLIKRIINACVSTDAIILDFFSGSATAAHATMSLNAEDGGNRKYIMVQLEEATDEKSEAYKEGYKYITDIGQERIRRAGKKIKEETNADIDYGFRVYKLDSSNMKDVYYKPSEYKQDQLELFENNIKGDRTSLDILTQVILDLGLTLDLKIEEKQIEENKIYFVETNALIACFDENINISIIDKLCQYKPLKLVFREHSFTTDSHKINFQERIKSLSPGTEVSIL